MDWQHCGCIQVISVSIDERVFLIFVRINNDLLLWEPTAPSPVETVESMPYGVGLSVASQLINTYSKDSFSQFRSPGPEGEMITITSLWLHRQKLIIIVEMLNARFILNLMDMCHAFRWDQWVRGGNYALLLSSFWPRPPISQEEEKAQSPEQDLPKPVFCHHQC